MTFARNLASLFLSLESHKKFSLFTRLALALMLTIATIINAIHGSKLCPTIFTAVVAMLILHAIGGLKKVLSGLLVPLTVIMLGFLSIALFKVLGFPAPTFFEMLRASANLATLLLVISFFFQLITLRELRQLLSKVGLGVLGSYLTTTLALVPRFLQAYADAYTATLLKYGRRKIHKTVIAMIIHAIIEVQHVAQAIHLYGLPKAPKLAIGRPSIKEIAFILLIGVAETLLFLFTP
jgi:hypothetical protein